MFDRTLQPPSERETPVSLTKALHRARLALSVAIPRRLNAITPWRVSTPPRGQVLPRRLLDTPLRPDRNTPPADVDVDAPKRAVGGRRMEHWRIAAVERAAATTTPRREFRNMNTTLRVALAAAALLASPLVLARTTLVASLPANGQALEASPTEIRLTFNEHVDTRGASVKLVSAKGQHWDCDRPHGDRSDANALVATVPVLRSGSYRARWTAVAPDGHKMHGDLNFSIK